MSRRIAAATREQAQVAHGGVVADRADDLRSPRPDDPLGGRHRRSPTPSAARNEVERTSRQIENGRYAIEVLSDEAAAAGFYGELASRAPTRTGSAGLDAADQCSSAPSSGRSGCCCTVQGWADGAGFDQTTCPLSNHKAGTDILLVRRVRTCLAAVSAARPRQRRRLHPGRRSALPNR
jgi:hypothetical protein